MNVYRFCSECPILNCTEAFLGCIYFESVSILLCDVFIHLQRFLRRKLISLQEVKMVIIQLYTAWLYWKKVVWGLRQNSEDHKLERKQNKQILQGDEYMFLFYFIAIIIISFVCDILSVNLELTFWLDYMVWHPFPFCPQCVFSGMLSVLHRLCRSRLRPTSLCIMHVTP